MEFQYVYIWNFNIVDECLGAEVKNADFSLIAGWFVGRYWMVFGWLAGIGWLFVDRRLVGVGFLRFVCMSNIR